MERALKTIVTYTITEAAKVLNVSRNTLLSYVHNGRLKAQKIGRFYIITQDSLNAFINGADSWKTDYKVRRDAYPKRNISKKTIANEFCASGFVVSVEQNEKGLLIYLALDKKGGAFISVQMITTYKDEWQAFLLGIDRKIAIDGYFDECKEIALIVSTPVIVWKHGEDRKPIDDDN